MRTCLDECQDWNTITTRIVEAEIFRDSGVWDGRSSQVLSLVLLLLPLLVLSTKTTNINLNQTQTQNPNTPHSISISISISILKQKWYVPSPSSPPSPHPSRPKFNPSTHHPTNQNKQTTGHHQPLNARLPPRPPDRRRRHNRLRAHGLRPLRRSRLDRRRPRTLTTFLSSPSFLPSFFPLPPSSI